MLRVPAALEPLLSSFSVAFTRPTFQRFLVLTLAAIVTPGRRTVAGLLRSAGPVARGHFSGYHRVFSAARWSTWAVAKAVATAAVAHVPQGRPVVLAVDDTVCRHRGPKVYGRGSHRDAVRSSRAVTVLCWGHRWVVLAVVVRLPFAGRPWALPVLAALYRNRKQCEAERRRFKSWADLGRQLAAVMAHWFPDRRFVLVGDGGYATHDLARFCHRRRRRLTLVTRFYADACLHARPPAVQVRGRGRPAKRGRQLPSPERAVAAAARLAAATVAWYGGGTRRVELLSAAAGWWRNGRGLVPVRWAFVRDATGTHRDEYFMTTDPALTPAAIVSLYTARWPIETTFQEAREHLGLETPRQRCRRSVLRTTPCLLGLYTVVALAFADQARRHPRAVRLLAAAPWYDKREPTFADALATVRLQVWRQTLLGTPRGGRGPDKWPPATRRFVLDCLARAA